MSAQHSQNTSSYSFISEATELSHQTDRSELSEKRFDFYTFACVLSDIYERLDSDVRVGNRGLTETAAAFLGRGTFSSVLLMHDLSKGRNNQNKIVTKFTSPSIIRAGDNGTSYGPTADIFRQIVTELRILSHPAIHKNDKVVSLRAISWDTGPDVKGTRLWGYIWPTLSLEAADCGSLQQLQATNGDLSEALKFSLCFDIAVGIDFLHSCGVTHGDVKAENVLIFQSTTKRLTAKLADFGSSLINEGKSWILDGGTDPWTAPEWGQTTQLFEMTTLTDNYSFGLLVLRMYIGGLNPFSSMDLSSISTDLDDRILLFKRKNLVLSQAKDLLSNLKLSHLYHASVWSILEKTLDADPYNRAYELSGLFLGGNSGLSKIERNEFEKSKTSNPPEKIRLLSCCPSIENLRKFRQELISDGSLDLRVRRQILECLQENEKERRPFEDSQLSGRLQYEIALCYLYGFGTAPCVDSALRSLVKSAGNGYSDAVTLVSQAHAAHFRPVPEGFDLFNFATGSGVKAVALRISARDRYQQWLRDTVDVAAFSSGDGPMNKLSVVFPSIFTRSSPGQLQELNQTLVSADGRSLAHFVISCNVKIQGHILDSLLDKLSLDVNAVDNKNNTLVFTASYFGNHEAVYALLSRGANVNLAGASGQTCLHFLPAFEKDQIHYIGHALVNNGANLEAKDSAGLTPLLVAIIDNSLESVAVLLKLGAKISENSLVTAASTVSGHILGLLFHNLCGRGQRLSWEQLGLPLYAVSTVARTVQSMIRHGGNLHENVRLTFETIAKYTELWCTQDELKEKANNDSSVLLQMVGKIGDIEIVLPGLEMYFARLMDSTALSQALDVSIAFENRPVFSKLLELGAVMESQSTEDIVSDEPYFIEQWAARVPAQYNRDGATVFAAAVVRGRFKTASLFLQDKRLTHSGGLSMSALVLGSAITSNLATVAYLAENLDVRDISTVDKAHGGKPVTILHYLATQVPRHVHDTLVVKIHAYILQKWRGLVNTPGGGSQNTPIFVAAGTRNLPYLSLLLENGADVNAMNAEGWTVMDRVLLHRFVDVWESPEGGVVPEGLTHLGDMRTEIRKDFCRMYAEDPDGAVNCEYLLQDSWLNRMCAVIVKAGGKSNHWEALGWVVPEDLSMWSGVVIDMKRTYIERCREEGRDVGLKSLYN